MNFLSLQFNPRHFKMKVNINSQFIPIARKKQGRNCNSEQVLQRHLTPALPPLLWWSGNRSMTPKRREKEKVNELCKTPDEKNGDRIISEYNAGYLKPDPRQFLISVLQNTWKNEVAGVKLALAGMVCCSHLSMAHSCWLLFGSWKYIQTIWGQVPKF